MSEAKKRDVVALKGGFMVPQTALDCLLDLEAHGYVIRMHGSKLILRAPPGEKVGAETRHAVTEHKPNLIRLIRYVEKARKL